jgi:hypothetical protein
MPIQAAIAASPVAVATTSPGTTSPATPAFPNIAYPLQIVAAGAFPSPYTPTGKLPVSVLQNASRTTQTDFQNPGQSGVTIVGHAAYGIYANQSIYPQGIGQQPTDQIYAPTMKGPGKDCLEITTRYTSFVAISIADFCNPVIDSTVFIVTKLVDAKFMSTYTQVYADGIARYTAESFVDATGIWHAAIFNFAQRAFEELYNTAKDPGQDGSFNTNGNSSQDSVEPEGWDIMELHLATGSPCPRVLPISSLSPMLLTTSGWQFPSDIASAAVGLGTCFLPSPAYTTVTPAIGGRGSWTIR